MFKRQKGEIATTLTLLAVGIMAVGALTGALVERTKYLSQAGSQAFCQEFEDTGQDYYKKGYLKWQVTGGSEKTSTDYCRSSVSLREYYCEGDTPKSSDFVCSRQFNSTCFDGVCTTSQPLPTVQPTPPTGGSTLVEVFFAPGVSPGALCFERFPNNLGTPLNQTSLPGVSLTLQLGGQATKSIFVPNPPGQTPIQLVGTGTEVRFVYEGCLANRTATNLKVILPEPTATPTQIPTPTKTPTPTPTKTPTPTLTSTPTPTLTLTPPTGTPTLVPPTRLPPTNTPTPTSGPSGQTIQLDTEGPAGTCWFAWVNGCNQNNLDITPNKSSGTWPEYACNGATYTNKTNQTVQVSCAKHVCNYCVSVNGENTNGLAQCQDPSPGRGNVYRGGPYNVSPGSSITCNEFGDPTLSQQASPKVDFNNDGKITPADWSAFLSLFRARDKRADLNADGAVNMIDLSIALLTIRENLF